MKVIQYPFYYYLAAVLLCAGCNRSGDGNMPPTDVQKNAVPMPSEAVLSELGPKNQLSLQGLLPDAVFVVVGRPKQFLSLPAAKENEQILTALIRRMGTFVFLPGKVEQFIMASGFPAQVPIVQSDRETVPQTRLVPIARRSTVIRFDEPVSKEMILSAFVGNMTGDETKLNQLKKTEGTTEYYDLTNPQLQTPQKIAVCIPDNRTCIIIEGQSADIRAALGTTDAKKYSAAIQRLQHTSLDCDLVAVTSLEGTASDEESVGVMLKQLDVLPANFVSVMAKYLQAVSASLMVSRAKVGEPLISVAIETGSEDGSKSILESLQGWQIDGQTTLAAMDEEAKKAFWMTPEFATEILDTLHISREKTSVKVVLNNFEKLLPSVSAAIQWQQRQAQELQTLHDRQQQLVILSRQAAVYAEKNKTYPADIYSADGQPLLSWRVAMLPILGANELYQRFKLDEPWDSPANKPLLAQMPQIFNALIPDVPASKTVIRLFNSEGTPFANANLKPEDIQYPQKTLLFVSAASQFAVEWTKPDKLAFDAENLQEIVGHPLLGVTFSHQIFAAPVFPKTDERYKDAAAEIESVVKGTPKTAL